MGFESFPEPNTEIPTEKAVTEPSAELSIEKAVEDEHNTSPEEVSELINETLKHYKEKAEGDERATASLAAADLYSWAKTAIDRGIPFDREKVQQALNDSKERGLMSEVQLP